MSQCTDFEAFRILRYFQLQYFDNAYYGAAGYRAGNNTTRPVQMRAQPTQTWRTGPSIANGSNPSLVLGLLENQIWGVSWVVTATGYTALSGQAQSDARL